MDILEKEQHFYDSLHATVNRHVTEYDLTVAQVLGVLRLIEANVIQQNIEDNDQ